MLGRASNARQTNISGRPEKHIIISNAVGGKQPKVQTH
jgi:hypothetical protein